MAVIRNTNRSPVALPGHGLIDPGKEAEVRNWSALQDNPIIRAWVKAGILLVVSEDPKSGPQSAVTDEKDELIARLAELGVKKNRRSSVESLQEALVEAEQAAAGDDAGESEDDPEAGQ